MVILKDDDLLIRNMKYSDEDFSILYRWLNDEQVQAFFEGKSVKNTYEQILDKFGPRAMGEHRVVPCIMEIHDKPIGYLQFYPLENEEIRAYGAKGDKPQYGMDLFIGETDYWNQGVGTRVIRSVLQYLFEQEKVEDVYIDPQTWNVRAIRCYEKCGFKKVKVLPKRELHDGEYKDNQIMQISKDEFRNSERKS